MSCGPAPWVNDLSAEPVPTPAFLTAIQRLRYQAITRYFDHYAPTQRTQWTNNTETARSLSSLSKNATNLKERAFNPATT